ncbi:septum formation initiator family protein [Actinomyces radicidentis]|uniref:FtsB family cell division protein n=1 Tax=Actinomyces radicidentis TaxID=111015 RepID=UPI0028EBB189|nr:septum formation initiator family protein [Actinomyces radicidentis]
MSPRRPAARPGNRAGEHPNPSRSRACDARGAASTRPAGQAEGGSRSSRARTVRSADPAAGTSGSKGGRSSRGRRTGAAGEAGAPQHTVLRLGGPDGVAVPARLLVLVLVLLGAFIVTFPSLRGYLHQQAQYDAVVDEIASAKATSTALEDQLADWNDDDYVKAQARERLSYVMPGETTYVVVGAQAYEDGSSSSSGDAASNTATGPWYDTLRESARVAGEDGEENQDPAQQGWSTAVPTVPTPTSAPTDLNAYSRTLGEP